ncbi:MAG TPA: ParB/RepB/Spo0J family partition protein, partial [Rhizobiaceae bacterium]|nr:ParB/RepB/Spo0J family partition protein [Rhizobiaceae bacterium]
MTERMIPLNQIRFGHEAEPPINARRTGREDGLEELAASIAAHGLIQALTVRTHGKKFYVADGNRRLAALRLRADRGEIAVNEDVKCDVDGNLTGAEEISLAANILRLPLHAADRYQAFRDLADAGLDAEDIAKRFAIDIKTVRQTLALGRLSPMLLDAWRDGKLRDEALRAFTLAKSTKEQERVFTKLMKEGRGLWGSYIRDELGASDDAAAKLVNVAGVEAYLAAGGKLIEDLFGGHHVVLDPDLAKRLADEKLEATIEKLKTDGWSWVALGDDLESGWEWNRPKLTPDDVQPTKAEKKELKRLQDVVDATNTDADLPAEAYEAAENAEAEIDRLQASIRNRGWTEELKRKSGAVVSIEGDGSIEIAYGIKQPKTGRAEKVGKSSAANDAGAAEAKTISMAMMQRLSEAATIGLGKALEAEPRLGLVALLAGLAATTGSSPVKVSLQGMRGSATGPAVMFDEAFERYCAMSDAELFAAAALFAGLAIDIRSYNVDGKPFSRGGGTLAAAVDAERLDAELRAEFKPDDYFAGVAKSFVTTAIAEAVNEDEARKADKLRKPDLVAYAVENVGATA